MDLTIIFQSKCHDFFLIKKRCATATNSPIMNRLNAVKLVSPSVVSSIVDDDCWNGCEFAELVVTGKAGFVVVGFVVVVVVVVG